MQSIEVKNNPQVILFSESDINLPIMKPNDLKAVFSWEERRPHIHDRVFFVPDYYDKHAIFDFPGWETKELFGNQRSICVEYCSGNGDWIFERAKKHPELNWIAVEKRFDRVRKIWSKIKKGKLSNLIAVCGEAFTFSKYYIKDASIHQVFINFPDPWPKEKHKKNRLVSLSFLDNLHRILTHNGRMTFVTDDADYLSYALTFFQSHTGFKPVFHAPFFTHSLDDYGTSWFESLWREKGRTICYTQFDRK